MGNVNLEKLGIIGSVGVPAKYGGFETLVHHLVLNLNDQFDMTIYSSKAAYKEQERVSTWNGAKIKYIPLQANGYQSVFYDLWSMLDALRYNQYLLILGVSAGIFIPILKLFTKKKFIVNIDGLEWRRPKWNRFAKTFLLFSEKMVCRYADEIITDNRILKEYVKIRYSRDSRLIEYGADHTQKRKINEGSRIQFPFLDDDYAFKVARIEPENHIHTILDAFSKKADLNFVLVGNWDSSKYGKKLRAYYNQFEHLYLLDPIYKTEILDVLRSNAYIYVHGHSAGGTNPSLVEAMYLKLPIISFDAIFNRVTTDNQAIFFGNAKELAHILTHIKEYPLYSISENLKAIADKKYNWNIISIRYAKAIRNEVEEEIYIPQLENVVLESKEFQLQD
ncbi:MAG: hypothetical protein ACI8P3_002140 [Saprospiraceae bacterium]|jgi:hypothetical protein